MKGLSKGRYDETFAGEDGAVRLYAESFHQYRDKCVLYASFTGTQSAINL